MVPPFQDFNERSNPANVAPRLAQLRNAMAAAGVDGFLVPRADAHRGENVPPGEERLAWLTGFTGSAGTAAVTANTAALFVDGRYTLQAPAQTDTDAFEVLGVPQSSPVEWLASALDEGATVGFDPWLHSLAEHRALEKACAKRGLTVKPIANPIDELWDGRPARPRSEAYVLDDARAGEPSSAKRSRVGAEIGAAGADAFVFSIPDSIAWLFNLRGGDISHVPIVLGYAVVRADGTATLFLSPDKHTAALTAALGSGVELAGYDAIIGYLESLGDLRIGVHRATCPAIVAKTLTDAGAKLVEMADPADLAKARKNAAEIEGMRDAHRLDGLAMARFLRWLDGAAPSGDLTEIAIAQRLEGERAKANSLVDISFDTISGSGPNGAIPHYRVTESSNRTLIPGELMLVDSGGQYREGTTDITRTMATGPVSADQKDHFTRVLKGMIALSCARFPKGTSGQHLDVLARQFLWEAGLNYNHGTGHGVGAFLNVHEGPANISPHARSSTPLEPGMILSNEPGYYRESAYGIRTENLILVVEDGDGPDGTPYYRFETLTLAPIDTRLVDVDLLTDAEREWLNAYHARVNNEIGPELGAEDRDWLAKATQPI